MKKKFQNMLILATYLAFLNYFPPEINITIVFTTMILHETKLQIVNKTPVVGPKKQVNFVYSYYFHSFYKIPEFKLFPF